MSSCSFDATAPQQAEATNLREPTCPPCTIDPDPSQTYFCPKNGKGCDRISIHTCQSGKCEARIWKTTYMRIIFLFPSASTSPYCKTCILQTLQKSLAEFMRWTSSVKVLEMNKASGISLLPKNEIWSSREGELEAIDPWFSLKLQSYRDFIVNHSTNDWKTEGSTIVLRSSSCSIVAASGPHWMEAQQKTGSCVLWAAQRNCPHELNTDPEYLDWRTCKTCELFVFFHAAPAYIRRCPPCKYPAIQIKDDIETYKHTWHGRLPPTGFGKACLDP